jgi:hypothetical protein
MSFRTHRFNIWHLLAGPTFNATLSRIEDGEIDELGRLEDLQNAELAAIRGASAPTPIGVKPRAEEDDDATATDDRDEEVEDSRDEDDDDDDEEEEEEDEEYEDDLGLDDASDA